MFRAYARCCIFLAVVGRTLSDFNVLLLHNNDMHSHFQQSDKYSGICENDTTTSCYGGFARLRSEVSRRKQEATARGQPTIFLNAGDSYQGTPYYTYFKWPIVSKFVSMLGIDVMSLGNHEFDDEIAGLVPYISNVSVPIVCSNLNTSLEPTMNLPNLTPSKIINVQGTKIGVIGYLTPNTVNLSSTGNLKILDEISNIRAEAQKLLSQGVNILIALGHSGYTMDQQIAKEVEEIDLVVGGHSHTFLYNGTPPDFEVPKGPYPTVITQTSGKQVPVVQAYYATKYLGYLELYFDDQGNLMTFKGSPILLNGSMPQDATILADLKPYAQEISTKIHKVLGYSDVLLDNINMKCKLGECNVGNLITDAFVDYVVRNYNTSQGWTQASIAIIQAGGIRASINTQTNVNKNGSITVEDVITVLPWGGNVVILNMTGSTLLEVLEYSVARYEQTITGHVSEFLQVSGVRVVYDIAMEVGHRIDYVEVLCSSCEVPTYQPLNLTQTYAVITPKYLAGGGDGFAMLTTLSSPTTLADVDYEIVAQYITAHSPIYPIIEGRVLVFGTNSNSGVSPSIATSNILLLVFLFYVIRLHLS